MDELQEAILNLKDVLHKNSGISDGLLKLGLSYEVYDWVVCNLASDRIYNNFSPTQLNHLTFVGVEIKPTKVENF